MAYDANGQRRQCIDLYKRLEEGHPLPPIRKQAYELRYIAEAPKIKMSPDEILTIPILDSNSQRYAPIAVMFEDAMCVEKVKYNKRVVVAA